MADGGIFLMSVKERETLVLRVKAAGLVHRARTTYDQALKLNPEFDVAVLHLGNLYFQTGRYDEAIKSYQRYISLAESDWDKAWGWGRIAWVHWRKGQISKAAAAAEKELRLDNNSFANSLIIAFERGDAGKAERFKQRLYEPSLYTERGLRPSLRRFYYLRGHAGINSNRPTEAIDNFRELLGHRPMIWDIDSFEDSLANAYFELGRFDEAIAEYQRILQINPNYPLAHFHLAQAFERKGVMIDAASFYRQFLEIWKEADADIPDVVAAKRFIANSL